VDKKVPHRAAVRPVEIDPGTPRGPVTIREESLGIGVQVIPCRSEVVVDHVDEHHETERVRAIDKAFKIVGRPVGGIRRERQHTVVAPVPATGKIGQRQEFDRRHAEISQRLELARNRRIGALRSRGPDMQLVEDRLLPWASGPGPIRPLERRGIDDDARPVHVIRLEAGGRIRDGEISVDPKCITTAAARLRND
jgi:hypothetical protein